jgi:hypothetical protein
MNISNKNHREIQKAIASFERIQELDNKVTQLKLLDLEKERDISIRTIADQAGKLLGHILFVKIK